MVLFARSKSTRLNSSHTVIYTLSLHDALPISQMIVDLRRRNLRPQFFRRTIHRIFHSQRRKNGALRQIEEHTSELQSHSDLHSFPTRRSSDLANDCRSPSAQSAATIFSADDTSYLS